MAHRKLRDQPVRDTRHADDRSSTDDQDAAALERKSLLSHSFIAVLAAFHVNHTRNKLHAPEL